MFKTGSTGTLSLTHEQVFSLVSTETIESGRISGPSPLDWFKRARLFIVADILAASFGLSSNQQKTRAGSLTE